MIEALREASSAELDEWLQPRDLELGKEVLKEITKVKKDLDQRIEKIYEDLTMYDEGELIWEPVRREKPREITLNVYWTEGRKYPYIASEFAVVSGAENWHKELMEKGVKSPYEGFADLRIPQNLAFLKFHLNFGGTERRGGKVYLYDTRNKPDRAKV